MGHGKRHTFWSALTGRWVSPFEENDRREFTRYWHDGILPSDGTMKLAKSVRWTFVFAGVTLGFLLGTMSGLAAGWAAALAIGLVR